MALPLVDADPAELHRLCLAGGVQAQHRGPGTPRPRQTDWPRTLTSRSPPFCTLPLTRASGLCNLKWQGKLEKAVGLAEAYRSYMVFHVKARYPALSSYRPLSHRPSVGPSRRL